MASCKRVLTAAAGVSLTASLAVLVCVAVNVRVSFVTPRSLFEKVLDDRTWPQESELFKCCRYGEQLDSTLNCNRRRGLKVSEDKLVHGIYINDTFNHYWAPKTFYNKSFNVFYGYFNEGIHGFRGNPTIISEEEISDPTLNNFRYSRMLKNVNNSIDKFNYCVDAYGEGGTVLVYFPRKSGETSLRKCCRFDRNLRILPKGVNCSESVERNAVYSKVFDDIPWLTDSTYQLCQHDTFNVLERKLFSEDQFGRFANASLHRLYPEYNFFDRETCVDTSHRDDGEDEVVLAACLRSIGGWRVLWHLTQPSCIVAALLLALALVSVALQPSLRSSNHGRALACHAASLLLLNILHIYFRYIARLPKVWEWSGIHISHRGALDTHARIVAYFIYLCTHAANCWVTILCFNTAKGLRRMRREPGHARVARGGDRREWGQFALDCSFGWGAPLALTSLVIYVYEKSMVNYEAKRDWHEYFIMPTLLETKTSFLIGYGQSLYGGILNYGTFYYYFLPAGVVLVLNLALSSFICFSLRRAKKETSTVPRTEEGAVLDSLWTYVRLLLTTSVIEAAMEIGAHFDLLNLSYEEISSREVVRYSLCKYETPLNIIDVIRAAIIFSLGALNWNMKKRIREAVGVVVDRGRTSSRAFVHTMRRALRRSGIRRETVDLKAARFEPASDISLHVVESVTPSAATATSTSTTDEPVTASTTISTDPSSRISTISTSDGLPSSVFTATSTARTEANIAASTAAPAVESTAPSVLSDALHASTASTACLLISPGPVP